MPTYVYGITDRRPSSLPQGGVDGGAPRVVAGTEIFAIVGPVGASPVKATRANLMAHSDVLSEAVGQGPVVPMRFGVVFPDDAAVRNELLDNRRDHLRSLLARVEAAVELTVSAYYVEEDVLRDVVASTPEIRRLQASIRGLPEAASYFQRIRLGELVAGELGRRRAADAAALVARLSPLALGTHETQELPERMVLKASFLVRRDSVDRFRGEVKALADELAGRVTLKLVGPLPPYSFVDADGDRVAVAS